MWQSVLDALDAAGAEPAGAGQLTVLDLGGGTGGDAVRLAGLGHRVTVVDPSPDALAALSRRAAEAAVEITGVLGDSADLTDHVAAGTIDLVICHGVIEHVDDPAEALAAVAAVLAPSGVASIVVPGRLAAVVARAVAGDFDSAQALMAASVADWDLAELGPRRYLPAELDELVRSHGLHPISTHGVRHFSDVVPSSVAEEDPGSREKLLLLERAARSRSEFAAASGGLQTLARLDLS